MNKPGILCIGLCSLLFSISAFAAQTDSANSFTSTSPLVTGTAMQNCPVQTVAGVRLRNYDQNIPLTNTKTCSSWMGAGSVGWGWATYIFVNVFGAGGSFEPRCDQNSTYPYLGGFSETTGGFFALLAGGGGGNMSYYCCSMSQTGEVSLKMGYDPNNPSTYNTWSTSCN